MASGDADGVPKGRHIGNQMVGGKYDEDIVGFSEKRGGQCRWCRVASNWLYENPCGAHPGGFQGVSNQGDVGFPGHDHWRAGVCNAPHARQSQLEQRSAIEQRNELLRSLGCRQGPQSGPRSTGEHNRAQVGHPWSVPLVLYRHTEIET
jgi:hypothetical protein